MADTSDFRNGLCIEYNNGLYKIVEFQHVKPGKGAAFVRTKLKNLTTGKVIDNTFNAGVKVTTVRIETRNYQYLYPEGDDFHFMHTDTFEQILIPRHLINAPEFLKEGMICDVMVHAENEEILSCDLPAFIELEITYTEPGIKGDTATNSTKPAKVETDTEIRVPLFINIGDRIKIDTREGKYCERIKQ